MLRPRADIYDGLHREELLIAEIDALYAGYAAGVRETEAELKARDSHPAPLPVPGGDEIPY
jgi:hypothetical protein